MPDSRSPLFAPGDEYVHIRTGTTRTIKELARNGMVAVVKDDGIEYLYPIDRVTKLIASHTWVTQEYYECPQRFQFRH